MIATTLAFVSALTAQCTAGDLMACQNLVREETFQNRKPALRVFLKRQCEQSNQAACISRARILQSEGRYTETLQVLETSCDAGTDEACVDLATALGQAGQSSVELSMKKDACLRGKIARACTAYGVLLATSKDLAAARAAFDKACDKGDTPACFNLQAMLGNSTPVSAKYLAAAKNACAKGDLYACTNLAGRNPKLAERRSEYYKLCKQHVEVACKRLSEVETLLGEKKKSKDAEAEYRKIFWRQCEQGDGEACLTLANYFTGSNEAKRILYGQKARKILSKACEQGQKRVCEQLPARPAPSAKRNPIARERPVFYGNNIL